MNIGLGRNGNSRQPQNRLICRFYPLGRCRFGSRCRNIHVDLPEGVGKPRHTEQNTKNATSTKKDISVPQSSRLSLSTSSISQNGADETSGPSASTSKEASSSNLSSKSCGICLDTISEKRNKREQTYGILPNCNHCFCFACLRKWRRSKEFDFDVSKACPECRKPSDYVYPSKVWYEVKEEKDMFISKEKLRMQSINCNYFRKGKGCCPFGNTCLYLHALPNGVKMDVGPPKPRKRRSSTIDDNEMLHQILFWLNDDDLDIYDDDDDDDDMDSNFGLDLDDPLVPTAFYAPDDLRRYIAMQEQFFGDLESEAESEDFHFSWLS